MSNDRPKLLPLVLVALNARPSRTELFDVLCIEIEQYLVSELNSVQPNFTDAMKDAVALGKNLGFLASKDDTVRLTFKYTPICTNNGNQTSNQNQIEVNFSKTSQQGQESVARGEEEEFDVPAAKKRKRG